MKQRVLSSFVSLRNLCLISACALAIILVLPVQAQAALTGVYVAPKFIYGYTAHDSQKASFSVLGQTFNQNFGMDRDHTYGGALAIGFDFYKKSQIPVRAELEYSIFSAVEANGSTTESYGPFAARFHVKQESRIQTIFLNMFYDIKTGTPLTPYVGGGAGFASIRGKSTGDVTLIVGALSDTLGSTSPSHRSNNFAWNAAAGIGWEVSESMTIDLGYRFMGLGESKGGNSNIEIAGVSGTFSGKVSEMYMHQIMLGLRFTF